MKKTLYFLAAGVDPLADASTKDASYFLRVPLHFSPFYAHNWNDDICLTRAQLTYSFPLPAIVTTRSTYVTPEKL